MRLKTQLLASCLLLASAAVVDAEVLTRYSGAFAPKQPANGWQYLWNAKGEIGAASNYEPLKWNEPQHVYTPGGGKLPNPAPAAFLSLRQSGGHPGRGAKQAGNEIDRYAIAAYTIPAGKSGVAWISEAELLRQVQDASAGAGQQQTVQLRVYLNDQLKHTATFNPDDKPAPFNVELGPVSGGETVYVAVGPDGNDLNDGCSFDYRIQVLPTGEQPKQQPGYSLLSEPADQPGVRRDKLGEPSAEYQKTHEQLLAKAKQNANAQIVFLGDSITAAWGTRGRAVWDSTLKPYKPLNLGVGGDTTQNVLWRIDQGELDGLHPKALVLLIGTNNAYRNSGNEIADGVEAVVRQVRQKLPETTLIVTGIFPRSQKGSDPVRQKIKQINERLAKLDDGQRVRFININDQLTEADGSISKELMPDFLHPNEPAYKAWAEAVTAVVGAPEAK